MQPDGKILLAGASPSVAGQFVVTRLNSNGTVDTSFGSGGEATVQIAIPNVGQALLLQTDGKILFAVTLENAVKGQSFRTGLARFNSNGTLDTGFGSGGTVITLGIAGCTALAELPDGEILALNGGLIQQFTANGVLESTVTGGPVATASANIFETNGTILLPNPYTSALRAAVMWTHTWFALPPTAASIPRSTPRPSISLARVAAAILTAHRMHCAR